MMMGNINTPYLRGEGTKYTCPLVPLSPCPLVPFVGEIIVYSEQLLVNSL